MTIDLIQAPAMDTKTCTKCHMEKALTEFNRAGKTATGAIKYKSRCKTCRSEDGRVEREKYREQRKANYQANRDQRLMQMRQNYLNNPSAYKERAKKWAQSHPEIRSEVLKRCREANPDAQAAYRHARRARLVDAFVEDVQLSVLRERDGDDCCICHSPINFTLGGRDPMMASLEHVVPLSRGGEHSYANTALSHLHCNLIKGTKSLDEVQKIFITI